jgi:hypothetical protein
VTTTDRAPTFGIALLLLGALVAACDSSSDKRTEHDATTDTDGSADTAADTESPADTDAAIDTEGSADTSQTAVSIRGNRYCEVLLAFLQGGAIEAQVWGTQGLNDCPAEDWATVDSAAIRTETGATAVVLNGPRHWVIDGATAEVPDGSPRRFGTLEVRQLATLSVALGAVSSTPYAERTVMRDSEFEFRAGAEIYELLAPNGSIYVMQSYAQIVDPNLTESDLAGLGARLTLPTGWSYRARTLEVPLLVRTPGEATVVQDELQNTYSRYVTGG